MTGLVAPCIGWEVELTGPAAPGHPPAPLAIAPAPTCSASGEDSLDLYPHPRHKLQHAPPHQVDDLLLPLLHSIVLGDLEDLVVEVIDDPVASPPGARSPKLVPSAAKPWKIVFRAAQKVAPPQSRPVQVKTGPAPPGCPPLAAGGDRPGRTAPRTGAGRPRIRSGETGRPTASGCDPGYGRRTAG